MKEEAEEKDELSDGATAGEAVTATTTTTELDTSQESIKTENSITTTEAKSPAPQGLYHSITTCEANGVFTLTVTQTQT